YFCRAGGNRPDGLNEPVTKATRTGNTITVIGAGEARNWTLCLRNVVKVNGLQGGSQAESEQGLVVKPQGNALTITL
ncbi:hypothetical protein, partial [Escherichia coli]|uniref:hypothetical protein n=1 Tax=Escherichia coli TaxID=562 RepID=UPI0015F1A6C7